MQAEDHICNFWKEAEVLNPRDQSPTNGVKEVQRLLSLRSCKTASARAARGLFEAPWVGSFLNASVLLSLSRSGQPYPTPPHTEHVPVLSEVLAVFAVFCFQKPPV